MLTPIVQTGTTVVLGAATPYPVPDLSPFGSAPIDISSIAEAPDCRFVLLAAEEPTLSTYLAMRVPCSP
jgi:hypothetical protein